MTSSLAWLIGPMLTLHISAGFVALFVAPGAMVARKGGRWHRRWGKVFFWAMTVVAVSAAFLASAGSDPFLFLVAVFSFYLTFSGYRVLYRKRPQDGESAPVLDWTVTLGTLLASTALALYGIVQVSTGSTFGAVATAFGAAGCAFSGRDLKQMIHPPQEKQWWFVHMGNMLGAYIATVSAFSAVNFDFLPPLVRWLWPTVIGGIGIFVWTGYYQRKFAHRGSTSRIVLQSQRKGDLDAS